MLWALYTRIWMHVLLCRFSVTPSGWTVGGQAPSKVIRHLSLLHSCAVLAVCLGSLSCWKVKPGPSLRFWGSWIRFSSAPFSFDLGLSSLPVPVTDTHTPTPPCYTVVLEVGQMIINAWFLPNMLLRVKTKEVWPIVFLQSSSWVFFPHKLQVVSGMSATVEKLLPRQEKTGGGLQW